MTTISAKVIADSVGPYGHRITTLECRYPRSIHSELMTHRVFSRNAASSRAIPVSRLIKDIEEDPFVPLFWSKNEPGMQGYEECDSLVNVPIMVDDGIVTEDYVPYSTHSATDRRAAWLSARDAAVEYAKAFADAGYHKQLVNRLLEPFAHITTLITSTQWSNFFALRRHSAAEPHFQMLADRIWEAMEASTPRPLSLGEWHLPYTDDFVSQHAMEVSVARCASVSYKTVDGKEMTIERAIELCEKLLSANPLHASPAEHQATPDHRYENGAWSNPTCHGNFNGWVQYRKTLPGECQ